MELAKATRDWQKSATAEFFELAAQMKATGHDIIDLSVGQPDFNTPDVVKQAAIKAILGNQTRYTPVKGIKPLLEAISASLGKEGLDYDASSEIIAGLGGKEPLSLAFKVILNPGDEVIIPIPCWPDFVAMVRDCGAIPVLYDMRNGSSGLGHVITDKTKAVVVNSPSNPTGMVWPNEWLEELAKLLAGTKIWIVADEVYKDIVFAPAVFHSSASYPGMKKRTILVRAASKTYAMTGWRIGYAAGPKEVIAKMAVKKQQTTNCTPTISQFAYLAALTEDEAAQDVRAMVAEYQGRLKKQILPFAQKLELQFGSEYFIPEGAFYLFFQLPKAWHRDCLGFCKDLLHQKLVAVVPGCGFEYPGWVRLSYAAPSAQIEAGLAKIWEFLLS